ncbi:hypothetical protein TNCV_1638081 [Trichonephila clavipes]|nr:hypothetical protein TNCV_1638081 [Trichonephila clavipes]
MNGRGCRDRSNPTTSVEYITTRQRDVLVWDTITYDNAALITILLSSTIYFWSAPDEYGKGLAGSAPQRSESNYVLLDASPSTVVLQPTDLALLMLYGRDGEPLAMVPVMARDTIFWARYRSKRFPF